MVGGLVQQQRVDVGEQDPGELDPTPLPAGQGTQRLAEDPVWEAEAGGDGRRLRLGGVSATGMQLGIGVRVLAHRPLGTVHVGAAHLDLGAPQPADHFAEPAGRQDPFPGRDVEIAGAGVLRQIADRAGAGDLPRGRLRLAGEDAGERRLAGPVAPDQADAVPRPDAERRVREQQPGPGAYLEGVGGEHVGILRCRDG